MVANVVSPSRMVYMSIMRKMYDDGQMTLEQYAGCLRRYKESKGW